MQIDAEIVLKLAEQCNKIAFWDLESTGLNSDYNSILAVSIKPYGKKPIVLSVEKPGRDKKLVAEVREVLHEFPIWVTYYGKLFDQRMMQGRLLKHNLKKLDRHHHIDMYFQLKYHVNTSRKSQAHLLEWLNVPEKKMTLSSEEWNYVLSNPKKGIQIMRERCASDTEGLEGLYERTKQVIVNVTR